MRAHKNWSYAPYRPPFYEVGDIYICRVCPSIDSIHFEWLNEENLSGFEIYVRERDKGEFKLAGKTDGYEFDITGLRSDTDHEFYVKSGEKKSRVRLARCGEAVDTVVNYLHPDDEAYSFSGRYLCSPSLVRHPEGYLLASMDLFAGAYPQNLTLIFRSDDDGKTWHYVSELFPCFWGKMFIYENELYMLACSTEYGDVLIGKSSDGGKTFCEPTVLLKGSNGKHDEAGCHRNPMPLVEFNGRLWNTLEYGSWGRGYHAPMVMSAKLGSDLLDADSWLFSEPVKFNPDWDGVPKGESSGNIEGMLVIKGDSLYNVMRFDMSKMKPNFGYVLAYKVNTDDPEAPLIFDHAINFPGNHAKFVIKYCEATGKYYSIICRITGEERAHHRNLLSLMVSSDLENWEVERDIFDYRHCDPDKVGFQYVDFEIEGSQLLYLCRTGINGAHNYHNTNYSTFGTLELK